MRINKVEELVGITKKNIRFYEEKGLLTPERNTENVRAGMSTLTTLLIAAVMFFQRLVYF